MTIFLVPSIIVTFRKFFAPEDQKFKPKTVTDAFIRNSFIPFAIFIKYDKKSKPDNQNFLQFIIINQTAMKK